MIVLFVEQATYPALRREYIFEFDRADVPDRIQNDALSGTHVIKKLLFASRHKRAQFVSHRQITKSSNEPAGQVRMGRRLD